MPRIDPTLIELTQMDAANLRRLAARQPVDFGTMVAAQGSLPPWKVVERALAGLGSGTPTLWCMPFLIVSASRTEIFGACAFKGVPQAGSVEINYGIAPAHRGCGIATAALTQLLRLAAASGIVREVVAHIIHGNVSSEKLVHRLGFRKERAFVDLDGADVGRWIWRVRDVQVTK
jgi:RimJ/RimL family protein N-acetyltransferase